MDKNDLGRIGHAAESFEVVLGDDMPFFNFGRRSMLIKKICLCFIAVTLCLFCLTACGSDSDKETKLRDYFVIETTETAFATPELDSEWRLLGTHFLNGEAIQIWGQSVRNEQLQGFWDVYVYYEDGRSEFKFGGIKSVYRSGWYMDEDGSFYVAMGSEFMKLDSEGKEVFKRTLEHAIETMYQDKKGNWMVLGETEGGALIISELDSKTGELIDKCSVVLENKKGMSYYAGQPNGIFMLNQQGVWKLNSDAGTWESVLSFEEHKYTFDTSPENFRVTEDGALELLLGGKKVVLSRVNMADSRIILTLRSTVEILNLKDIIANFNRANDTYYVVWEQIGERESVIDYKAKVGVEIAAGGGPDLMLVGGAVMPTNIIDYVGKGVFEKLNPYMEKSGVTEENYFPLTFNGLMDGEDVYGITIMANARGNWISAEVLGGTETPTIEELVDALLTYEEKAVFREGAQSYSVLSYFLRATDSIHGAVDWEAGTCNFVNNKLFEKILQVCLRYGDDEMNNYPAVSGLQENGLYGYTLIEEQLTKGQVPIWYYFDEGCCPGGTTSYTIAVNSNSNFKDGAWTFIEYLLNGELQSTFDLDLLPVQRSGFEEMIRKEMEEGSLVYYMDGGGRYKATLKAGYEGYESWVEAMFDVDNYRAVHDITEEKAVEIRQMLEATRTFPVRTEPIRTIVQEETGAYFSGQKSLEEVCALIQNRVQLYLDEKN